MTLLWMDGFDHYGTESNTTVYGTYATATGTLSTSIKRTGAASYGFISSGSLRRVYPSDQTAVGVGLAIYFVALPAAGADTNPIRMLGASGYGQCFVRIDSEGHLQLWAGEDDLNSGFGTQIFRTSTAVFQTQSWQHLECFYVPNGATSTIEVRVDGVTLINETFAIGSSTYGETTATTVTSWEWRHDTTADVYIDDLYAWNDSGSYNNDFLGDKKVHTMMPNGDTTTADWAKSTGTVGYSLIDEIPPNGDTDYISSVTAAEASTFDFEAMPANTGAVNAIQTYRATMKTDAGTCDVRTDMVSGASTATGTAKPATTAYQYYTDIFETDPATGALWTKSGVDAAQVKVYRSA